MFPPVVHEHSTHPFNFYFNSRIHMGINYQGKLYRLTESFQVEQKDHAYAFANEHYQQGNQAVITASDLAYKVWVNIRATTQLEAS